MKYVFADEAGCLVFRRSPHVSRYFILCTVTSDDCCVGNELLALRRELAWEGLHLEADQFHASEDPEAVRQRVFQLLAGLDLQADITLFEKSKALPRIRETEEQFYKYAWYFHFKNVARNRLKRGDDVLIHAASIGTKKRRQAFRAVLNDVAQQVLPGSRWQTTFWQSSSDPCLQVADYLAWAVQRKVERNDARHHSLIAHHICSEYDIFRTSELHHY